MYIVGYNNMHSKGIVMKKRLKANICMYIILMLICVNIIPQNASAAMVASDMLSPVYLAKKRVSKKSIKKTYTKDILVKDTYKLKIKTSLKGYSVSYKSSNSSVIKVKKSSFYTCKYTGVNSGTAYIVVKIKDKSGLFFLNTPLTLKYKVKVSPRAISVKFKQSEYQMVTGDTLPLTTTIRPSISTETPTYEITDKTVAEVSDDGIITAKAPGITYVTATLSNGVTTKAKIVVEPEPPAQPTEKPDEKEKEPEKVN